MDYVIALTPLDALLVQLFAWACIPVLDVPVGLWLALLGRIMTENPGCHIFKASLTLSPAPHAASMTYDWEEA